MQGDDAPSAVPLPHDHIPERPAVLDVHKVALQEIDLIVGNEATLGEEDAGRIRGILRAALSEASQCGGDGRPICQDEDGVHDRSDWSDRPASTEPHNVTWGDLQVGSIVRYQHLSRARRLAGKPLVVKRARVVLVAPPTEKRFGQLTVAVLNKDGTEHARLGRVSVFALRFVVSIESQPDGGTSDA